MIEIKKATLRIPTKEQYAYIELVLEDNAGDLLQSEIIEKYQEMTQEIMANDTFTGATQKDWVRIRRAYCNGEIDIEDFEMTQLNPFQKFFINELKKEHAERTK